MPVIDYNKILVSQRFKLEPSNTEIEKGLSSDKSRVIFSGSFRRLQQKAQVFSLEKNSTVRSRLTHTLEVANTGSLIARKIAETLISTQEMDEHLRVPFIDITETTCLLHDIGNPPFGHFGEEAIKKWFDINGRKTFEHSTREKSDRLRLFDIYMNDFVCFDGNPQGIRIMLHLQDLADNYEGFGLNLTFSQILSCIKYTCDPSETKAGVCKKPGYFHSEKKRIDEIKDHLNWNFRFPITFIMEAADDISYCLSDIEDGIEKDMFTAKFFFEQFIPNINKDIITRFNLDELKFETKFDFFKFKIAVTRNLIKIASEAYIDNQAKILNGELTDLFSADPEAKLILKELKKFARMYLFRSREAENKELAGYRVIFGLLDCFKALLELKYDQFKMLVDAQSDIDILSGKRLDIEWRLYNRLPKKHLSAYHYSIKNIDQEFNKDDFECTEWYYRAHLLLDYISGMTDNYALETYHLLNGTSI